MIATDKEAQKCIISLISKDLEVFTTVKPILQPDYFDKEYRHVVQYLLDFTTKYGTLPSIEQLNNEARTELINVTQDISKNEELKKSICDDVESFCKQKALELAVLEAVDRINKGENSGIDTIIKNAQMVSLEKDLGIEFWEDQANWLHKIDVEMGCLSTGWRDFDAMLNGGIAWGDLVYVVSCSGGGKSLALANLGLNYSLMGYNVAYLTLELDKALVGKRIMAMAGNIPYPNITSDPDQAVDTLIKIREGINPGMFRLIDVENGSTPQDVESLIKEVEAKYDTTINVIIIDYADLMRCNEWRQVKAENTHLIGKKIAEELRAFAKKRSKNGKKTVILTASQIGKDAMSEEEYNMDNIAGSAGKSFTADLIFSVKTNLQMRQMGLYELKVIKARNSGCTDRKMKLKYNTKTLLMTNLEEDNGVNTELNLNPEQKNATGGVDMLSKLAKLAGEKNENSMPKV